MGVGEAHGRRPWDIPLKKWHGRDEVHYANLSGEQTSPTDIAGHLSVTVICRESIIQPGGANRGRARTNRGESEL